MRLPETFREAARAELVRVCHPPYEVLIVVLCNGMIMLGAWFIAPPALVVTKLGLLAFPLMLASWMFSDVPATNVLGSDAARTSVVLARPTELRRLFYAKNLVLWLFVTPLCLAITIGVGVSEHRPMATIFSVVWIGFVPLGALGVAAWLGILWPYHPMRLAERWRNRRPYRRMIIRWSVLVIAPYVVVPALTTVILAPTLVVWYVGAKNHNGQLSDPLFAAGTALACVVALNAWVWGHHYGTSLARRRRDALLRFLAQPTNG